MVHSSYVLKYLKKKESDDSELSICPRKSKVRLSASKEMNSHKDESLINR